LKSGQTPSKGTFLSLLSDVLLTNNALLAALTSTSRRLLSQPSVSARLSEASQQAQHNPAAMLHYLRRHLLVSTWHMRMQHSSMALLLKAEPSLCVIHNKLPGTQQSLLLFEYLL